MTTKIKYIVVCQESACQYATYSDRALSRCDRCRSECVKNEIIKGVKNETN